jgi:fimbrial chaperone protein
MLFTRIGPVLLAWALTLSAAARAAGPEGGEYYSIQPLRLAIGASARTALLTVKNEHADRKTLIVYAEAWRQDDSGADVVSDTSDLVFFPRRMVIPPGGESVVRLGVRSLGSAEERTYRLYVEETEARLPPPGSGSAVSFRMRFAVPVFVAPTAPRDVLRIGQVQVSGGKVQVTVENQGNRHQEIGALNFEAAGAQKQTFSTTVDRKYLLAGASRRYQAEFPADICRGTSVLMVTVPGNHSRAVQEVRITPDMCG